jgi:hypothetical protein
MSAGWEGWGNDSAFEGRLRLIGQEEGTIVKIVKVNQSPPIIIRKEATIAPDETKGEVDYPTFSPPPLVRKKEAPIKPEP